jgi:hypothetical protein
MKAPERLKRDPEWELEGKFPPLRPSLCNFAVAKKAMSSFFFSFCCNEEGDGNDTSITFCFGLAIAKKAMRTLLSSPFFLQHRRRRQQHCGRLLFWSCYDKKKIVTVKKATLHRLLLFWFYCNKEGNDNEPLSFSVVLL